MKTIVTLIAASILPVVAFGQSYNIGDTIRTNDEVLVIRDLEEVYYPYEEGDPRYLFLADTAFPTLKESVHPENFSRREARENVNFTNGPEQREVIYRAIRNVFSKEETLFYKDETGECWVTFVITADFDGKPDKVGICIMDEEPTRSIPIQKWMELRRQLKDITLYVPENARKVYKRIWALGGVNTKRAYE